MDPCGSAGCSGDALQVGDMKAVRRLPSALVVLRVGEIGDGWDEEWGDVAWWGGGDAAVNVGGKVGVVLPPPSLPPDLKTYFSP